MSSTPPPPATPWRSRLAKLLRSPVWWLGSGVGAVLCVLAGPNNRALLLVGGGLIVLGLGQQVVSLAAAWRAGRKQRFWVPVIPAAVLTVGIGSWWWANQWRRSDTTGRLSPALIELVVAIAVVLIVLWLSRGLPAVADTVILTRHLPGGPDHDPVPGRWTSSRAVIVLGVVWVLGFIGGGLALPPWWLLGLAVVAAVALLAAWVSYQPLRRHAREVDAALRTLAPVFVLPYNGAAAFHVGMWADQLATSRYPVIVATTRDVAFDRVPERSSLPVLYAPTGSDAAVARMFPATVRAALYVFNGSNSVFLRQRQVRHIFLQHGDSDKDTSTNPVTTRYDTIAVSGQAGIDRFRERGLPIPVNRFAIVGRPQTARIHTADRPIAEVEQPVVLYAPTWKGKNREANYSSLLVGPQITAAMLERGATVIFRPHPAGRSYRPHAAAIAEITALLAADAQKTGRAHRFGPDAESPSVAEISNLSDALISDVSGIVTDYMQTLKPFAMVATRLDAGAFRRRYPTSEAAYVIEGDLANLDAVLDDLLGGDPLAARRRERRCYYLGGSEENESAAVFAAFVDQLATAVPMSPTRDLPEGALR